MRIVLTRPIDVKMYPWNNYIPKLIPGYGLRTVVSQFFGANTIVDYTKLGMKGHNGWDIPIPMNTPIRAAHDGTVTRTEIDNRGGIGIDVITNERFDYDGKDVYFKTRYWHILKNIKTAGDIVKRGDIIALSDNTGFSTGPHLHFGLKPCDNYGEPLLRDNGYQGCIDPFPYFSDVSADVYLNLSQTSQILKRIVELYQLLLIKMGK